MTMEIEYRTTAFLDYELRNEGSERLVCGIAAPYDIPTTIYSSRGTYEEVFTKGAFNRTLQQSKRKVKVYLEHDHKRVLGAAHELRDDPKGLYAELRISKTAKGDEILELVKDGALDAFSVGFKPVKGRDIWSKDQKSVKRTEVQLVEVSLTTAPAYEDAVITSMRNTEMDEQELTQSKADYWRNQLLLRGIRV